MAPSSSRNSRFETVLKVAAAVVACGFTCLAAYNWTPSPELPVRAILGYYERLTPAIPGDVRVGFVGGVPDGNDRTAALFLAQHAFAPRLVTMTTNGATFAISAPFAGPATDADPALREFELVKIADGGVRLYRRR